MPARLLIATLAALGLGGAALPDAGSGHVPRDAGQLVLPPEDAELVQDMEVVEHFELLQNLEALE